MSLIIRSLTYVHSDKETLFEQLNLIVAKGDKAALVGNNGAGKSTLLQIIGGQLKASWGEVIKPERLWYVPQHLGQYNRLSVVEALGVAKKLKAIEAITNGDADLQYFTDLNDDWEIEEKLARALAKWDIAHLSAWQKMEALSGGEKTKVFLAGIYIHEPEVVLLDEPSNHLDISARTKLYDFIVDSKATILVVSHDRTLLNLLHKTLELSSHGIEVYGGNFDFYREQKDGKVNALQAQLDEQFKTLKQTQQKTREMAEQRQKREVRGKANGLTQSLPRIVAGNLKSKAERSTAKVLDAHQEKTAGITENIRNIRSQIQQYQVLSIDIGSSELHRGKMLIDAEKINFSHDQQPLWHQPLSFQIRSGDRVRISGDNGSGKTTLVKIITGALSITEGKIARLDFAYLYLDQDYTLIDRNLSVYEQVQHHNSRNFQEHELKSLLIYSHFQRDMWDRKCAVLSGGEKMKLSLCCLAVSNHTPDMLILDEPTNNLDVQSLEVLTTTIKGFNGTLLIISHDQYFIGDIGIDHTIYPKHNQQ